MTLFAPWVIKSQSYQKPACNHAGFIYFSQGFCANMKIFPFLSKLAFFALGVCTSQIAQSAAVTMKQDEIVFNGRIVDADVDRFIELSYGKPLKKVIFHESTGGQWSAGQRLGNLLMGKNITTVVDGVCASTCAMAFLGGDIREFSDTSPKNLLIFHAPYLPGQAKPLATLKEAFFNWIELRTGKPVTPAFRAAIDGVNTSDGGVFFFSEPSTSPYTRVCKGDEEIYPKGCQLNREISPDAMGVLTKR